jgi:single-strand DNA-binding protein
MASGMNLCTFIGNLGADPEVKFTPGGQAVANFRIAVTESWKDKSGQKQERTEWVRLVAWGKLAEVVGEHCTKGKQIYVAGKMQTREWTDKEGKKNYTTEIIASNVLFLGSGGGKGGGGSGGQREENNPPASDDDIPF